MKLLKRLMKGEQQIHGIRQGQEPMKLLKRLMKG